MARTNTNTGGGVAGIESINGDTTQAQLITGGTGVLINTVSGDTNIQVQTQQTGKGILTGGAVWSGTGFTFDVTTLTYYIDGVNYGPTAQTSVTLAASDPSDPRFDVIVVDDAGVVSVVTGTPNTPPAVPEVAWNEVPVTIVLVEAGSTTPTITQDLIYNENTGAPTEWATSVYSLTGPVGTVVFNSTDVPYNGAVCAQATGTNNRRGMRFTRTSDINIQQYGYVALAFRIDSTALPTNKSPIIRFQNSGGTLIGNSVNLVTYGLQRNVVNTWQLLVIPTTAFGSITNVRSLTAIVNGSGTANWSMDLIFLSGGIPPQSNLGPIFLSATNTLYSAGAAQGGGSGVNDSIFFGEGAGSGATGAYSSIFLGDYAGYKAPNAFRSQFIGEYAGYAATSAQNSTFIGYKTGFGAVNALQSVFVGQEAGDNTTNTGNSVFIGYRAGQNAAGADTAFFGGVQAGQGATSAYGAVFVGYQAGLNAVNGTNSVFIGQTAGANSTATLPNILIGAASSDANFNNVIAIGTAATATKANQFLIAPGISNFSLSGMQAFDDDAAAGAGGVDTGELYQTTGAGAAPLNVAGIIMIKQ